MQVSSQTQAVLLLTAHFSRPGPEDAKPLTPTEWGRFAQWLKDQHKGPDALLQGDVRNTLANWSDPNVSEERITRLLDRGSALAIAMEKWQRSGLWVLTRSDADYPARLKKRLKTASPAVLFGCGNARLLNQRGIAVVGSRNASGDDLSYADRLGALAAATGVSIVSGGARGIDEAAISGALKANGTVVGVLADSLLRACSSQKYRRHLLENNLLLISPYYPEAQFNSGNAMGRNKYIYCLSDAAVIVHSGKKGGTWSGALENLKKGWVPTWVKPTKDASAGNADIVRQGARWASEDMAAIDMPGLFDANENVESAGGSTDLPKTAVREPSVASARTRDRGNESRKKAPERNDLGFYDLFLIKLQQACEIEALEPDELANRLGLKKAQLDAWLKRAVAEKKIEKLVRPVRYQWNNSGAQRSIF